MPLSNHHLLKHYCVVTKSQWHVPTSENQNLLCVIRESPADQCHSFDIKFHFDPTVLKLLVPSRPLLLSGGGFLRLLCQQSQNAGAPRLHRAQLERGESAGREKLDANGKCFSAWSETYSNMSVLSSARKEFEIELEGSQTLRLLCYEKCCNKTKQSKEDGEVTDKITVKGQIKVPLQENNMPTS